MLQPLFIKATSLSDAWFQTLYRCVEQGRSFVINRGSFEGQKRLEFDHITIHITHPASIPLLPKVNPALGFPDPVDEGYLDDYLPYLMTGEEKEGESYTYGQRICKCDLDYLPDAYKKLTPQDSGNSLTTSNNNQQKTLTVTSHENFDLINQSETALSGIAWPNAVIALMTETQTRLIQADSEGIFTFQINLIKGFNEISLIATDETNIAQTQNLVLTYSTSKIEL